MKKNVLWPLQSPSFTHSIPHKQRSVQARLCVLHERRWVTHWILQEHLTISIMDFGAGNTSCVSEWIKNNLPHQLLGTKPTLDPNTLYMVL